MTRNNKIGKIQLLIDEMFAGDVEKLVTDAPIVETEPDFSVPDVEKMVICPETVLVPVRKTSEALFRSEVRSPPPTENLDFIPAYLFTSVR